MAKCKMEKERVRARKREVERYSLRVRELSKEMGAEPSKRSKEVHGKASTHHTLDLDFKILYKGATL
jgi:hypothetical protein